MRFLYFLIIFLVCILHLSEGEGNLRLRQVQRSIRMSCTSSRVCISRMPGQLVTVNQSKSKSGEIPRNIRSYNHSRARNWPLISNLT